MGTDDQLWVCSVLRWSDTTAQQRRGHHDQRRLNVIEVAAVDDERHEQIVRERHQMQEAVCLVVWCLCIQWQKWWHAPWQMNH